MKRNKNKYITLSKISDLLVNNYITIQIDEIENDLSLFLSISALKKTERMTIDFHHDIA